MVLSPPDLSLGRGDRLEAGEANRLRAQCSENNRVSQRVAPGRAAAGVYRDSYVASLALTATDDRGSSGRLTSARTCGEQGLVLPDHRLTHLDQGAVGERVVAPGAPALNAFEGQTSRFAGRCGTPGT